MTFHQIGQVIRHSFRDQNLKVPTRVYPNWFIRVVAQFNPTARGIAPKLGKLILSDNSKATRLLDWKPRPKEETILASVKRILEIESQ